MGSGQTYDRCRNHDRVGKYIKHARFYDKGQHPFRFCPLVKVQLEICYNPFAIPPCFQRNYPRAQDISDKRRNISDLLEDAHGMGKEVLVTIRGVVVYEDPDADSCDDTDHC